ncbi:oxidoreductase [Dactylosporangium sp. NPDC049742]|uniref:oxidoreductase n=1 Tax=Dactylosporangium sp. NPDC049742 TaxID=3154737 RepID=UPI003426D31D
MDLHLSGKTAVVTGASKGIGLAVTQALAAEGVRVVAGARTAGPDLTQLSGSADVRVVEVDLSTADGPARLVDTAVTAFGGLDILVNNVGAVRPRTAGFLAVTDEEWTAMLTLNLLAAVRTTRAALPHLLASGAGSIVTVGSVNATLPDPLVIDYSAAKAALASFSKSLSKEFGGRGVRVNTVSPGPVSTGLWLGDDGVAATVARSLGGGDPGAVADRAAGESVTGRFTRPQEVADLVLLLASDRTANVTGADFAVDGGLVSTL